MPASPHGVSSALPLLHQKPFAMFWCARVSTALAFQMQAVAVGWQGYALGARRRRAVHSMFIGTSNQLGEFESGVTAALFGTVPTVLLVGVGTILMRLLWVHLFPELARIESLKHWGRQRLRARAGGSPATARPPRAPIRT